jgi:hypothetical protein
MGFTSAEKVFGIVPHSRAPEPPEVVLFPPKLLPLLHEMVNKKQILARHTINTIVFTFSYLKSKAGMFIKKRNDGRSN